MSEQPKYEAALNTPEAVLSWWFGDTPFPDDAQAKMKRWFMGGAAVDEEIRARFAQIHAAAHRGELDAWTEEPTGRLALVIVLDQFSRSLGRGTAAAFENDARARELVHEGIGEGVPDELTPIEQGFFYMPLMHSESLPDHELSVASFTALVESQPEDERGPFQGFVKYAHEHRDIIVRFGRYPYRNAALGRTTTPEEQAYLDAGADTYGQG